MKKENRYVDDEHFRKLADTVPAIFWITDKAGQCVFLNKRWFEITGQTEEESLGLGWTNKLHSDDAAHAAKTFIQANDTATAFKLLYRLQQKNGAYRWAVDHGEPRYDNDGNFDGFTGTVTDVHEQIIANEKITETEELFRIALESADMGTFDYYPQSGQVLWSSETKALFGLPPDADIDHLVYKKGVHPADLEKSTEISGAFNNTKGGLYENEYRTIGITDGITRWVRSKGKITVDETGKATRLTGVVQDITREKAAERALRESEERYQHFIHQSREGIWRIEMDAPISIALPPNEQIELFFQHAYFAEGNQAMAAMYGFANAADLIGIRLNAFFPRDNDTEQYLMSFIQSGYQLNDTESKELDKDGKTKYFLNNLSGVVYDGNLVRAWGTQRDVTAQKTAVRQLEESEERFRALGTATSDVIYRMNTDWSDMRTLEGKGALSSLTGPIISWLEKYIWPEDREQVLAVIKEAREQKAIFELEHRVFRADGSPGWTFSRAVPILDEDGNISEWFGAASDITSRKHAEEELKRAREESESRKRLYETITSSTPDLIYVFDLNYRFTYMNAALLQMWGKTWEEAVGNTLQQNGYEAWHATMHEREIDHVINTKTSIRGEVSFHHAKQGKRIYDYIFSPVINDIGEVEAIAGTSRDITDIKAAEELLKQGREKLESQVAERTRELQRSNEDLEQFAHVASHDLKEPVRKMLTYSMILRDEFNKQLNPKAEKSLAKIVSSAVRMHAMIDGVLLYSSLHNMEKSTQAINLNETVSNIESDLEILFKEKQATIRYTDLPTIIGSPVLIYQLFYNLISNSLKFARPDVAPFINVQPVELSGEIIAGLGLDVKENYVAIRIEDNGIGFNNEHAEQIFRAFIRLNSKDKFEGTGLGLSLCQKIVERHHGAIYAEGTPNQGAIFTIVLPNDQHPLK